MNNYEMNINFSRILAELTDLRTMIEVLLPDTFEEDDLWDNSDIIRNWKVSSRTLSEWRKKGLISYVQVQSKIWYTKDARDEFINNNIVTSICSKENFDGNGRMSPLDPRADDDFISFIKMEE